MNNKKDFGKIIKIMLIIIFALLLVSHASRYGVHDCLRFPLRHEEDDSYMFLYAGWLHITCLLPASFIVVGILLAIFKFFNRQSAAKFIIILSIIGLVLSGVQTFFWYDMIFGGYWSYMGFYTKPHLYMMVAYSIGGIASVMATLLWLIMLTTFIIEMIILKIRGEHLEKSHYHETTDNKWLKVLSAVNIALVLLFAFEMYSLGDDGMVWTTIPLFVAMCILNGFILRENRKCALLAYMLIFWFVKYSEYDYYGLVGVKWYNSLYIIGLGVCVAIYLIFCVNGLFKCARVKLVSVSLVVAVMCVSLYIHLTDRITDELEVSKHEEVEEVFGYDLPENVKVIKYENNLDAAGDFYAELEFDESDYISLKQRIFPTEKAAYIFHEMSLNTKGALFVDYKERDSDEDVICKAYIFRPKFGTVQVILEAK